MFVKLLIFKKQVNCVYGENAVAKMCGIKVLQKHKSYFYYRHQDYDYRKKEQKELAHNTCVGGTEASAEESEKEEQKKNYRYVNTGVCESEIAENVTENDNCKRKNEVKGRKSLALSVNKTDNSECKRDDHREYYISKVKGVSEFDR